MLKLLFTLFLLVPSLANAKIRAVASITPLASLVAMVGGEEVEVHTIAQTQGCPHHYALKPSDLKKSQDADLIIYINDSFDHFASKLAQKSNAEVIKVGSINDLELLNNNWHLWLLPKNASLIAKRIESYLEKKAPEKAEFFRSNLKQALFELNTIEQKREELIHSGKKFILLTDSAEYLFKGSIVEKLYQNVEHGTLQWLNNLKKSHPNAYYIISTEQDLAKYRRILGSSANIVQLSTENWTDSSKLEKIYLQEYDKILDVFSGK